MKLTHILVDFDNVKPTATDIALARGDNVHLAVVRGPQQTRYEADLAEALHAMGDHVSFTRCAKAGKNAADMQIAFHLGELVAGLGATAAKAARFVVISRDKDFDPLVLFLQARGFDATRAPSFKAALGGKAAEPEARAPRAPRTRATKSAAAKAGAAVKAAPPAARKTAARKAVAKKVQAPRKAVAAPVASKAAHAVARTPAKVPAARDAIGRIIEGLQRKGDERPGKRKGLERFVESHLGRNLAPGQLDALLAQLERDGVLAFRDNKVEYRLPKAKK